MSNSRYKFKYIDPETEKAVLRDRLSSMEVQISQASTTIRLLEDSGEDVNSTKALVEQQENIIKAAERSIKNLERYLAEIGGDPESEASQNNREVRRSKEKGSKSSKGNGKKGAAKVLRSVPDTSEAD